jgi:hypothetical protein
MRERSQLEEHRRPVAEYKKLLSDLDGARAIVKDEADAELRDMAKEELKELEAAKDALEERINLLLIPRDPWMTRTPSWRSVQAPAAMRQPSLPPTSSACIRAMPTPRGWKLEVMSASETALAASGRSSWPFPATRSSASCAGSRASTGSSGCHPPRAPGAYTPAPSPWPSCPRRKRPRSRYGPRTSGSMSCAPAAPAASA